MELTYQELYNKYEDALKENRELKKFKKMNYIQAIKRFGAKYSDEELEKKSLEQLETVYDACRRFNKIDMSEEDRETVPIKEEKNSLGDTVERIDFTRVWDDVDKEFNMTTLKSIGKK